MHKYFEYIGIVALLLFSFVLTEKTTMITKDIDEIMIEIKDNYSNYNSKGMDATINGKYIVPGRCEKKVNISKSYNKMRKIGFYNSDNYIYNIHKPSINIYNNYNKYIISGNKTLNNIYFFIELNTSNIKYLKLYRFNNYNFIVSSDFYLNNKKIINELEKNNNSILISQVSKKQYKKVSNDYFLDTNKRIYCYNNNENNNFLNLCSKYKSNTIGNIKSNSFNYLYNIKSNLYNGIFIKLSLNDELVNELSSIDKYINMKGYNIKNIDDNLGECKK